MKHQRSSGVYSDTKNQVIFDMPVLSYKEDNLQVIYAPSLDIFGYGKTESEAKNSFKITLEEFIRYTTNKGTLDKALKQMGWKIIPKKHIFQAPSLGYMLEENQQFNEIFNKMDFKKYNEQVGVSIHLRSGNNYNWIYRGNIA